MNQPEKSHGKWDQWVEDGVIDLYLAGELDADTARQVEDYLTSSAEARRDLEYIRSLDQQINTNLNDYATTVDMTDRMVYRVLKGLQRDSGRRAGAWTRTLQMAAGVLVLMGAGLFATNAGPHPTLFGHRQRPFEISARSPIFNRGMAPAAAETPSVHMQFGKAAPSAGRAVATGGEWKGDPGVEAERDANFKSDDARLSSNLDKDLAVLAVSGSDNLGAVHDYASQTLATADSLKAQLRSRNQQAQGYAEMPELEGRTLSALQEAKLTNHGLAEKSKSLETEYESEMGDARSYRAGGAPDAIATERAQAQAPANKPVANAEPASDAYEEHNEIMVDGGESGGGGAAYDSAEERPAPPTASMKLIKNGSMEFEVESYAAAVGRIGAICKELQAFIASESSSRGENGRIQGTVVVKVVPENFERLIDSLRALGDLKNLGSEVQDVTKAYFDYDSRIRNLKVKEARLLEIIAKRDGKMEEILKVEESLATTREEIELLQGELNYLDAMVRLSTLTIDLTETGVQSAAVLVRRQEAALSTGAKDVPAAFQQAKDAAATFKARILDAKLNETSGSGNRTATVFYEVPSENFQGLLDFLKTLGLVLSVDNQTIERDKDGRAPKPVAESAGAVTPKIENAPGRIALTLFKLNPYYKETVALTLAAPDVQDAFQKAKSAARDLKVEIKYETVNRDAGAANKQGTLMLEAPSETLDALLASLKALGKVQKEDLQTPNESGRTEKNFGDVPGNTIARLTLVINELTAIAVENVAMGVETEDVRAAYERVRGEAEKIGASLTDGRIDTNNQKPRSAYLAFEVDAVQAKGFQAFLAELGHVMMHNIATMQTRKEEKASQDAYQPKELVIVQLTLKLAEPFRARTAEQTVRVANVDQAHAAARDFAEKNGGVIKRDDIAEAENGVRNGTLSMIVPLDKYESCLQQFAGLGVELTKRSQSIPAPENEDIGHRKQEALLTLTLTDVSVKGATGPLSYLSEAVKTGIEVFLGSIYLLITGIAWVLPFALPIAALVWWKRRGGKTAG